MAAARNRDLVRVRRKDEKARSVVIILKSCLNFIFKLVLRGEKEKKKKERRKRRHTSLKKMPFFRGKCPFSRESA